MSSSKVLPGKAASSFADRAYRRAWWSLALYPVSIVAAFVIGEGILSALADGSDDRAAWKVLLAAVPALVVMVLPGVAAVHEGRKARRLGRSDGQAPAVVGAAIGIGFIAVNVASYVLVLVAG